MGHLCKTSADLMYRRPHRGAQRVGHQWIIPANAPKPKDARVKSGKYIKSKNENGEDIDEQKTI